MQPIGQNMPQQSDLTHIRVLKSNTSMCVEQIHLCVRSKHTNVYGVNTSMYVQNLRRQRFETIARENRKLSAPAVRKECVNQVINDKTIVKLKEYDDSYRRKDKFD